MKLDRFFLIYSLILSIASPAVANVHRIEIKSGTATILRDGAIDFIPVVHNNEIYLGDLLLPEAGAIVNVRCADGILRPALANIESGLLDICPDTAKSLRERASDRIFLKLVRGEFRFSSIGVEPLTQLRWPEVKGAKRYRVWLASGQTTVWETSTTGNNVEYNGPELKSRTRYRLVVVPEDVAPETVYALDFLLVDISRQASIDSQVAEIEQRDGSELAIALMKADYFLSLGNAGDSAAHWAAIAALEPVKGEEAIAWRMLGDSYLRLGWLDEAEATYEQGLRYAIRTQNLVERGHTQAGFAHVRAAQLDWTKSSRWLEKAKTDYEKAEAMKEVEIANGYVKVLRVLIRGVVE